MQNKVIHGLPTPFTHATSIQYKIPFFWRLLVDKIFPRVVAQEKKAALEGTFDRHTNFQGNEMPSNKEKE